MGQIIKQVEGDRITLFVSGRLEFQNRKDFLTAIDKAKRLNPHTVFLNFSNVLFINSAGLALLMWAHKSLEEANIRLILEVPSGYVMDVFTLTNIGQKIPIFLLDSPRHIRGS